MIRRDGARTRVLLPLTGLLSLLLCIDVRPAFAASYVVTKTADTNDGTCNADCSLREAITAANAAGTSDTITFASGANGMITLTSALPILANSGSLTITGNGAASTIVSGNAAVRVLEVASGATVAISGMKIAGGFVNGADGGGILNNGALTVTSSTISGNLANDGGGILNNGTLTVTSSVLSGNYAIFGNGGAVWNVGTMTLANSRISDNHADRGGGVGSAALSASTVTSSTLSANEGRLSGGGIRSAGTLNLNNSIVTSSTGGDCENGGGIINAQRSLIGDSLGCVNGTNSANLTGDPALNGDLTLRSDSRAINAGSNALIPAGITTDLAGSARIQFSTVDMGAYESAFGGPSPTPTPPAPTPTPALVQTFVVTKTTDSDDGSCDANDCSLREAITRANALSTDDTITFKSSANGTITLGSALPELANKGALTITGNGRTNTIVNGIASGGNAVRVFRVASGATVKIANMTITKGDGGITNFGGTLTVTSCSISGNSTAVGGGIANVSVVNSNATLTVTNSTISGNSAPQGGGIATSVGSVTTVSNSTISGNSGTFGGGIANIGTLNLDNSIVANSSGGDCSNDTQVGAVVNARNSLIEEGLGCVNGTNVANLKRDPALNTDLTPSQFSRAINAGDNALIPAGITTDLAGNARIQSATVDIGAYESSFSGPVLQQTFVVTKKADTNDGSCSVADCSLREAITAANDAPTSDTITFAPGASGTITLGSELPVLASGDTLTITGNGAASTVISGGNTVGVFKVASDATVKVSGVTITQGKRAGSGGGIWNDGTLTVTSSRISGNSSTGSGAGGGGILNGYDATLTVTNSTLSGNSADSRGGGISTNAGSTTTVTSSTISGNSAVNDGGISNAGTLILNNSIVAGNSDSTFSLGDDDCDSFGYAGATVTAQNSLVEDGSSCGVVGGTGGNVTGQAALNGDLTLSKFSPAINAGSNALIPAGITTDLAGNARIQSTMVDMGAYESAFSGPVPETFVVTKTADTNDGSCDANDCSLREAITAANASVLDNFITFAPSANGTITLTSALPGLANNGTLRITGNGAPSTIVSGNNAVPVFTVGSTATVAIDRLTVANGRASSGAGIMNGGTLTVTNSIFSGNTARSANSPGPDGDGGAIVNGTGATMTLTNVAASGNSARYGAGILNDGTLTMTNSTFSGNSAVNAGSGIYNATNGMLNLRNSIVANGTITGGVNVGTTGVDCTVDVGGTINAQNSLIEDTLGCINGTNANNLTGEPALEDDLTLSIVSPAINAGKNAALPGGTTTDLAGNPRVQFTTVDMGAYESPYSAVAPPTPTPSAKYVVTKTADTNDGSCDVADCSLREAITAVNANGSAVTKAITFASSANGTITLGSALPALGNNGGALVITGNGRTQTIISGNNAVRVFDLDGNAPVTISRMTIASGKADQGGGIRNYGGTLTVANSVFSGNSAIGINGNPASAGGGGIFNFVGTLTLTNTVFTGNSASYGGALLSNNGTATVTNSTIKGNPGGGVTLLTSVLGGTLNLNNSIVDSCGNQDTSHGTVNARNSLIEGGLGCVNGTNTANLSGDAALNGDLTPSSFSRAINAGDNALVPAGTILDLAGNARVQSTAVDMGAFESAFTGVATPTPTPSPTRTPTATPSATPTKTPTPTPSPTPSKTPAPTPTPSKTPKPTASPTPSATPRHVRDDYDGDLVADLAVYETATGTWRLITSTYGPFEFSFGGPGFTPVPGDFYGSGTTLAVYDVATGAFSIAAGGDLSPVAGAFVPAEWVPAQADYDGDGLTDAAVYNKVTGQWSYRRSSDDALAGAMLGGTGFRAIPADFDGDGKDDVAVFQIGNGAWTYISSATGMQVSLGAFGAVGKFVPVPADYDGDGKADQALYQKKKGKWRFRFSSTGTTLSVTGFGGAGWLATPGDFDGDGKVDAGIYRKSTGGWRYRSSSTGVKTILPTLGGAGFVPVVGLRP
ncbi:CSLREA domain-containing protein [Candidatus Binatia bacterium]|nr:CSLREA domain-containing protein [Candidatus Binatia bacterium]